MCLEVRNCVHVTDPNPRLRVGEAEKSCGLSEGRECVGVWRNQN